jgi:alginate O-acetyltransferase complex protein AlgJ
MNDVRWSGGVWLYLTQVVMRIGEIMRFGMAAGAVLVVVAGAVGPPAYAVSVTEVQAQCARLAQQSYKANLAPVVGNEGWLFFGPELRHVSLGQFWGPAAAKVSRADQPSNADPLPAILDFQDQLRRLGIGLLMVPVPPKVAVYPDRLFADAASPEASRLDSQDEAFYTVLRKHGVDVLDLFSLLVTHRSDPDGPVFCKTDTHWSGRACVLAARAIAAKLTNEPWVKAAHHEAFAEQWRKVSIEGDLARFMPAGQVVKPEEVLLRIVGRKTDAGLEPVQPERNSPLILLGDSHTLVFHSGGDMLATGAGVADQLAYELGFPVDLIGVRGSGATPARISLLRRAQAKPAYLSNKKLVIWLFTAREFTESEQGWEKVPVK